MSRAVPATSAADDAAIELPLDFSRTATTGSDLAVHALEGEARDGVAWATAFAVVLFRYNGQASIPLATRRGPSSITMAGDRTARAVTAEVEAALARPATIALNRAGVAFTELEGAEDALAVARAEAPLADLHLLVGAGGATIAYNARLFRPATIARSAGHLLRVLGAIAAAPDTVLSALPLLTEAERVQLDGMSDGGRRALPDALLHEVIAGHARTTPDAIAVMHRDARLTYAALDRRANQVAQLLVARGIGAEQRVLVCVEPSLDIAVALLGILKAGAVYVPLEPTYPAARIAAMLEDTQPKLVLSQRHLVTKLGLGAYPCVSFDRDGDELDAQPGVAPRVSISGDQTAYVYYTSGTTGRPKGVMASHHNLVTYIQVAQARYEWSSRDVSPAIARFSFSISMFELMCPLVAGGTLVVLDRDHVLDQPRMAKTLSEVTFFHAGPSLLKGLIAYIRGAYADFSAFEGVRHASSGGDMIAPEVLEALKEIFARAEVFVIYGCSEISCMGCTYPVPRDRKITRTYVGAPFANTVVRILDRARQPVPVGVAGEICFSGDGVVKGYLDRPELTTEKFIEVEGRRYYTTGDIGRMSEDGWVEILGRNDFQIKVRGMRIELGEVEYNLRLAPSVKDGVVVARPGPSGEMTLYAYVVLDSEVAHAPATTAIRRFLTERLPDYMVPPSYVVLDAMPLNHNMKLDRRALPDPQAVGSGPVRAPETQSEVALAKIWTTLLDVPRVGLDDNFFQLGADSLRATQLVAEARRTLGVTLDGMDVLRESLEVLAGICDRARGRPAHVRTARKEVAKARVTPLHFGDDDGLYGVLHEPTGPSRGEAVLVCAPLGQERVRTHFILASLGQKLAERGIATLRFDYAGTWDSLGETTDATVERWQADIRVAHAEVMRRTGATKVAGLGVRLGATLLAAAGVPLSRVVLWDPVVDGAALYDELVALHGRAVAAMQHLRLGRAPRRWPDAEELLGSTYSSRFVRSLRALRMSRVEAAWLGTSPDTRVRHEAMGGGAITVLDLDCGWSELGQLEDLLPDAGVTRALLGLLGEGA